MSSGATVAQRRHIGLQQLQAIAATARSFLGPGKRLKFIRDEDDAVLVGSCLRLLERMQLDGSVAQLLLESVQAQQRVFHCGTSALVFLAGVWSGVALECLNRGMTVTDIKAAMSRALDVCLQVCRRSAVSLRDVSHKPRKSNAQHLRHSRHLSTCDAETEHDISGIAQALSHGCEASTRLLIEASRLQCESDTVLIEKLVTCVVPGPSVESRVFRGYVTTLPLQQASLVRRLQGRPLNVASVDGDLSENFRHVGFGRCAALRRVADGPDMSGVGREERWIEDAVKTLHLLNIDVLLLSGRADLKLKERCSEVLFLEGVGSSVLKEFRCTGAVPVSYVTQLSERCVGRGLSVSPWRDSECVSVRAESSCLVTALITSSVPAKLQILEDEFWSCAHRLHQALADGKLLRGTGTTELLCVQELHRCKRSGASDPQDAVVLELMAEAWMDYVSTLMLNSGSAASKAEAWTAVARQTRRLEDGEAVREDHGVFDNLTVKCEAWRRALDLVLLVLQSDTEIITGVSDGHGVHHQLMCL